MATSATLDEAMIGRIVEILRRNVMAQDALTRRLEIVGKAANQLGESFRQQYPDIP